MLLLLMLLLLLLMMTILSRHHRTQSTAKLGATLRLSALAALLQFDLGLKDTFTMTESEKRRYNKTSKKHA
jgi:hypothetical protein